MSDDPVEQIPFNTVRNDRLRGGMKPVLECGLFHLRTESEWTERWAAARIGGPLPEIDWPRDTLIAIVGSVPDTSCNLRIKSLTKRGSTLDVDVETTSTHRGAATVVSRAWHVVAIRRAEIDQLNLITPNRGDWMFQKRDQALFAKADRA
jgi:hypothetical protein